MRAHLRKRLAAAGRDERGLTLIELMVAMLVTSIILATVGAFFVAASKAGATNRAVDNSTRQATTGITQITRYLQVADRWQTGRATFNPAFITASPTHVQFYSNVDITGSVITPVLVDLQITSANKLQLQVTQSSCPSGGYCTFPGPTTTSTLAATIVNPTSGGNQLFSYFDDNGAPLATGTASVTGANLDSIRQVNVALEVGATSTASANDTQFQTTIDLRNLDGGAATGGS